MAYSRVYYPADGVTKDFTFSFSYIDKEHVKVYLDGVLVTNWVWLTDNTIRFATAPTSGVVQIRRSTSVSARLVDYTNPSSLNEADLDRDSLQAFYLAQEAIDETESTISENVVNAQFTAKNKRITNVADPVNSQDAVTKAWAETSMSSSVALAAASAQTAVDAVSTIGTSVSTAVGAAETATEMADTATTYAGQAYLAQIATQDNADTVASSVATAISKAAEAVAARDIAVSSKDTAVSAMDDAVAAKTSAEEARDIAVAAAATVTGAGTGDMKKSDYDPNGDGIIAVAQGGTGASSATTARTNLGLGSIATQESNSVSITGGTISGITDLAVADGGTGASTAAAARTNLGLGNVDNTSDADKPVSTATQNALNLKSDVYRSINTQTGSSYTIAGLDALHYVRMTASGAKTLTIPANSTTSITVGAQIDVVAFNGDITLSPAAGVTLNTAGLTIKAGSGAMLVKVATDEWDVIGATS